MLFWKFNCVWKISISHCRYEKDILLSGLVYCHRISNTQMAATSVRHLRTFEELCGKDALENVILATTMWDEVDEATGKMEEERMKTKYWNKMLERRSTTGRFLGTYESALQLLEPLIDAANLKRSSLLLQYEMVDMGKELTETSAGRRLFTRVQHIVSQRQEVIQQIQKEMRRPVKERASLQPLQEEHQKLSQSLESTIEEMRKLNLPVALRFLETSERWFLHKLWVLRLKLAGPGKAKVGEAIESEASYSKEPFKGQTELPCETAEVDSGELLSVSMIPSEPAKVDEAVDCIESEASPASCSKDLSVIPNEKEAEVNSGEVLNVSSMIPSKPVKVDEALDCIDSEVSPASCWKELPEIPGETEAEVDPGEVLTIQRGHDPLRAF